MAGVKRVVAEGRALAAWVLAVALVRVVILRAFGAVTGLVLFRQNYDADRLPPVAPRERAEMPRFSGCVACGRCDVGESDRVGPSGGRNPGVMRFVLASSRSMPDYDAAVEALAWLDEATLLERERLCPADVPMAALARFVRNKEREARG